MVNAQEWLDQNYPKEERKNVKSLDISRKDLEGRLDLSDFVNLITLYCNNNNLTSLDISKNVNLTKLECYNNNIQPTNIAIFSHLVNIRELKIGTMENSLKKQSTINSMVLLKLIKI